MKLIRNIILLLFFSPVVYAQSTLQDYLKIAAENNPSLKAKYHEYMAVLQRVPQVGTLPDPSLSFGYFISTPETRVGPQRFSVSLMQKFPWFGLLETQKDAVTQLAKAKYELFEQAKSELFYQVRETYYRLYFIRQSENIIQENISLLKILKNYALVKVESGQSTLADIYRLEMEINELDNQWKLLKDKENDLVVKFQQLLNQPMFPEIPDSLEKEEYMDFSAWTDSITTNYHLLQYYTEKSGYFLRQQKVAEKKGMPDFAVGVNYINVGKYDNPVIDASENGKDILMFPSVSIRLPIYRKKYVAMIEEARLMETAQNDARDNQINRLKILFEKFTTDYEDATRRVDLYQKQTVLAQKSLDILTESYATATKGFDEVLAIERQLLKYKLEHQKALTDQKIALAFLHYLNGN